VDLNGNGMSNDIQKILDGFSSSKVGEANDRHLAAIKKSRLVYQYNIEGNLIKIYKSLYEAGLAMKRPSNNIFDAVRGFDYDGKPVYQLGGFIWKDKPTEFTKKELDQIRKSTNIRKLKPKFNCLDAEGNILGTYNSPTEAAEILFNGYNSARRSIERCIKKERPHYKGYYFDYAE